MSFMLDGNTILVLFSSCSVHFIDYNTPIVYIWTKEKIHNQKYLSTFSMVHGNFDDSYGKIILTKKKYEIKIRQVHPHILDIGFR